MGKISTAITATAACLALGATVTSCSGDAGTDERSAEQLLNDAYKTMKSLKSVTVDADTTSAGGKHSTSRLRTDLKSTCTFKSSSESGAALEQIRIGETDYIRPNRAYLDQWSGQETPSAAEQVHWIKKSSSESAPGDGLSDCTWPFTTFGKAKKGKPTTIGGHQAIALTVTDGKVKGGAYTFHVATEGKPYLLNVTYKGPDFRTTTTFSAFNKPLEVEPPAEGDLLDLSGIGD
ncbi:hypothetical protein ABZS88_27115 [Streptomyces sp. NPDC005480]|uniref:hypothetical protein n=1 Tax=Streptomyces sp. NPDC005480 TaxID=3154880 RepID=UPI00339E9EE9